MRPPGTRTAAIGLLLVIGACTGAPAGSAEEVTGMQLESRAFAEGMAIPSEHTCDGADSSPPLSWSDVPDGTAELALVVEDPDARGFVHWLLTGIPGDRRELAPGEGDAVGLPGRNDFGRVGWAGPCPPSGEHRYVFTIYALSGAVQVGEEATAAAVRAAIDGLVLAEGRLTGVYSRR